MTKFGKVILLVALIFIVASIVLEPAALYAGKLGDKIKSAISKIGSAIKKAASSVSKAAKAAKEKVEEIKDTVKAKLLGDPVLMTSGQYNLVENELTIYGSSFNINREYLSEETVVGSFGRGWATGLDSRIIRGITEVPKADLEQIKGEIGLIEELVSDVNEVTKAILEELRKGGGAALDGSILDGFERFEAMLMVEDGAYDREELIRELREYSALEFEEEMTELNGELAEIVDGAVSEYEELKGMDEESQHLDKLNKLVLFNGTPASYRGVGNGNIVLITDKGTPVVFEPSGDGAWKPSDPVGKLKMEIRSLDGKGAESTAGFVLNDAGGVKRYFDGDGLLEAVEELNGERAELERVEGRVTQINGPYGAVWKLAYSAASGGLIERIEDPLGRVTKYEYTSDLLVRVTDTDGDVIQYMYEDEYLRKIAKSDGSYIELEYGEEQDIIKPGALTTDELEDNKIYAFRSKLLQYLNGVGGIGEMTKDKKRLVTSTTHEEGGTERFTYHDGYTVHTNHSGVENVHYYDDKHKLTEERYADGTIKTFAYNPDGQMITETTNGFTTAYTYDGRGNISEKSYSDGTRETMAWNGSDQVTRHVSRDGVVTEWTYDELGNCTLMKRGGEQVFSGVYDGNKLMESREGNRAVVRYTYDSRGFRESATREINGQSITERWEYDALGRVTKYTDGAGRATVNEYGPRIQKVTNGLGLETSYVYNSRKDLVYVVEKDVKTGEIREIFTEYDRRHLPVLKKDGAGNEIQYSYRADGLMMTQKAGEWTWDYEYDGAGRRIAEVRGKAGSAETFRQEYGYNRYGWEEERTLTLPGVGTTVYRYNAFSEVTSVTNALGEASTRTLNGAGNPVREQGASGGFYTYRYDASGRLAESGREGERTVQIKYNSDGTMAEKTDRLGNTTRYAYEGRGLLAREISPLGEKRYSYDNAGRVTREETISRNGSRYLNEWQYNDTQRTVTKTAGGTYVQTMYLNAWNEAVMIIDGEGNGTRNEYDGAGKLVKTIDGYGRATSYEWNELGKVTKTTYADNTGETHQYDAKGNLTETRDALGVSWAGEYDAAGRLIKETGRPGINKEYKYDALGRIAEVRNGGEVTERYRYTNRGREVVFTDGEGGDLTQNKNAYGEFVDELNRLGDSARYGYDAEGRPVLSTAYSGKQTKIEYRDAEGIFITTYSDGTQSVIERDLMDNIIRASGVTGTIRYKYDAGGKLTEQTDEGANEVTRYAYDRAGRRVRMQSGNRDVTYRYGRNGELLNVSDQSQRLEVSYEYDVRNRETRRVYGNGVRQETLYDLAGRIILIRETGSRNELYRAEGYIYDSQGRRSHSVDEEGKVTKYEYDVQSRIKTVLYPWTAEKVEADRKEAEEAGLYFTPDKGTGERYSFNGTEQTALRDLLNKAGPARGNAVGSSQMVWRESYAYDRNGNRATKTTPWGTIRYVYDAENRLVKKGDVIYTNDKDGNTLTEKGLRYAASYEYNGQNRMVHSVVTSHVEKTHVVTLYGYDALGRRATTENVTGQTVRTLYDGQGFEVIREGESFRDGSFTTRSAYGGSFSNGQGGLQSGQATGERYRWLGDNVSGGANSGESYTVTGSKYGGRGVTLYGNGEAVAVSSSTGSRSMYLGKDIMGSVRSVTADNGMLEDRYEYDAFGLPYKGDLEGAMNLGYTGKPYDSTTGLYNYGYRDFDPQAVRFTTPDPVRDGNNWFAYVNNDPVNYKDPFGLKAVDTKTDVPTVDSNVISVNAYIVDGTGHTPESVTEQFNNAEGIFNSQGVSVSFDVNINTIDANSTTGMSLQSITVSDDNTGLMNNIGNGTIKGTDQQVSLLDPSGSSFNYIFTGNINATGSNGNTLGYSFNDSSTSTTTSIISSSAAPNTTAHETGHVLGLGHEPSSNNLMYGNTTNGQNTNLTSTQVNQANSYLSTYPNSMSLGR